MNMTSQNTSAPAPGDQEMSAARDYVLRARHVKSQLMRWGDGFVVLFGISGMCFLLLGLYAMMRGDGSPEVVQSAVIAFMIALALGGLAVLWRCAHSTAEVTIELLTEIAGSLADEKKETRT